MDYGLSSVNRYEKNLFVYIVLTYWTLSLLNHKLVGALFSLVGGGGGDSSMKCQDVYVGGLKMNPF